MSTAATAARPPQRIQIRRRAGWRKPGTAISVARPTRWGNPFRVGFPHPATGRPILQGEAVALFRLWLSSSSEGLAVACSAHLELSGKDLMCWCKPSSPCHADVLLEVANCDDLRKWLMSKPGMHLGVLEPEAIL